MMTTSEKATQKATNLPTLSVHHTSFFLWALCQEPVRSTTHRFVAPSGAGSPLREIAARSQLPVILTGPYYAPPP